MIFKFLYFQMFQTCTFSSLKISPISKQQNKSSIENQCQTNQVIFSENSCQTTVQLSQFTQTEPENLQNAAILALDTLAPDQLAHLNSFLKRVEPDVTKFLHENWRQAPIFRNYLLNRSDCFGGDFGVKISRIFASPENIGSKMEVTSLAWNSNGSILAASYGQFQHDDWWCFNVFWNTLISRFYWLTWTCYCFYI